MREITHVGPGPDVVLYAPTDELTGTELLVDELRAEPSPNPAYGQTPSRRRRRRTVEEPAADLYGGYDGLLVRTALIRSKDYSERRLPKVDGAKDIADLCKHLIYADSEFMVTLPLSGQNQVRAIHEAAVGPADHVAFTAQQVMKVAMLTGSTAFVMVHNHPSGDPRPSMDDASTTIAVARAASCVGITLLDHVIVAEDGFMSFLMQPGVNDFTDEGVIRYLPRAKPAIDRWR